MRALVLLLSAPLATGALAPVWGDYKKGCAKSTFIFNIPLCLTPAAWAVGPAKYNHVANIVAQLLDNDADGVVDDPAVHAHMVSNKAFLFVPATDADAENFNPDTVGLEQYDKGQMSGLWEAIPNSCDAPTNRGASATDRSTWAAAIGGVVGCDSARDATTEEVLHLITEAASAVYPAKWGKTFASESGAALSAANGNCGWGFSGDFIDPASSGCVGQYAYNDETCDLGCVIVEGIYWASISYVGGLYTTARADIIKHEWLMPTPDDSMAVEPAGVGNAKSLQTGSPALYALVSDTSSTGHAWLPAIMPDGNYQGPASANTPGVVDVGADNMRALGGAVGGGVAVLLVAVGVYMHQKKKKKASASKFDVAAVA